MIGDYFLRKKYESVCLNSIGEFSFDFSRLNFDAYIEALDYSIEVLFLFHLDLVEFCGRSEKRENFNYLS